MKKILEKKINLTTFIFLLICAIVISALATFFSLNHKLESNAKTVSEKQALVAKLIKADELLSKKYLYDVPANAQLVDGILTGYVDSFADRYAVYLDKNSYRAYNTVSSGYINMLGIVSSFDGSVNGITVEYVVKGSPADKAGILRDDVITHVGGIAVTKHNYFTLCNSLMGKEDSKAELQILRASKIVEISATLSQTKLNSVSTHLFEEDGVGLISISYFNEKTADDFKEALQEFDIALSGLIIDLRGCVGGNLEQATKVLDSLLPEMTLYTAVESENMVSPTNPKTSTPVLSDDKYFNCSIAVVTDAHTKSTAEIFAAVLQSNDCFVIGTETYGKVFSQDVISLGDETGIYFTAKKYLDSTGKEINSAVIPNEVVELSADKQALFPELEYDEDDQITKALEHLKSFSANDTPNSDEFTSSDISDDKE